MSKQNKIHIKCPNCGYEWNTKSKLRKVSCSSCGYKVPNPMYGTEQQILMEHFNLGEDGVKILDRKINWVVDVYFKRNKVWCDYCKSENCRHVKFALGLAEVQKILKKKGWKIKPS